MSLQRTSTFKKREFKALKSLFSINDFEDPFMRMISVLRFTFTKEAKFVVAFIPFYIDPQATYYHSPLIGIAWQSVQTLQLRSW